MIRAVAKASVQLAFGRMPYGHAAYRALTRGALGTAASHVDKLARVWPGYVAVWRACGIAFDDLAMWAHDAGATPFMPLAIYLLTGRGGVTTNAHDRFLDRYLDRARAGVLAAAWPDGVIDDRRRATLEGLRWRATCTEALAAIGSDIHRGPATLAAGSIDLCHSGGALEHESAAELRAFVAQQVRVLRPGGLASHVYDHRDHLHHADRGLPFLAHLAWRELPYRAVLGHPLGFHARLTPTEVQDVFAAAGLERVLVRRLIYAGDERRWVEHDDDALAGRPGIERRWLAPRFASIGEPDLRTAAAHYLYRKALA